MSCACGPGEPPASSSGEGSNDGTTTASTTAEPDATTGVDSGTTAVGTTASDPSGTDTGTTGGGLPECIDPEGPIPSGIVHPEPYPEDGLVIDADCTVVAVDPDAGGDNAIDLSCDDGPEPQPVTLAVVLDRNLPLPVTVGQPVHLRVIYGTSPDLVAYQDLALSDEAGTLLVGQLSHHRPVGARVDDRSDWYLPLVIGDAFDIYCATAAPDPDAMFIDDPCPGYQQWRSFEISGGDETIEVNDAAQYSLAGYQIFVGVARRFLPVPGECDDVPSDWERVVMIAAP